MRKLTKFLGFFVVIAILAIGLAACGQTSVPQEQTDQTAVAKRANTFQTAEEQYPVPNISTFPLRQALIEYTEREALVNHAWYIYLVSDYGTVYQYYVAKTAPINACDFLSSTQNIVSPNRQGNVITSAPSYDGIYYGGAGGASSCTTMFFFDAATDALMEYDVHAIVSDVPLSIYKDVPFGGPSGVAPTTTATAVASTATVTP